MKNEINIEDRTKTDGCVYVNFNCPTLGHCAFYYYDDHFYYYNFLGEGIYLGVKYDEDIKTRKRRKK